ncbi:MAG: alkane 1-monooxygenase [Bacteroidia bacterium]|jgi:alkane 1-monooxygenase
MAWVKYCASFILILLGYVSLKGQGVETYYLVIFGFVIIPAIELIIPESKSTSNIKYPLLYDLILYAIVPLYVALFILFFKDIGSEQSVVSMIGKVSCMGLLCGIFGINMAHELGHRKNKFDQFLAQFLLLTSQYTHFFIEHNRGHHKRVGTPQDPATARKGEHLYRFWVRVISKSYISAWHLEKERLNRKDLSEWTWKNDMIKYVVMQLILVIGILTLFGLKVLVMYFIACGIGIVLLETINYIEHYGLRREKISKVTYEKVQDVHSWNSDYILGRSMLFELTRHSHHHANTLVKYPNLESRAGASQLPTGYPGMMILSLFPFLWFKVMDKRLPINDSL